METFEDIVQDSVEDVAQDSVEDAIEESIEDIVQDIAQDSSKNEAQETVEDIAQETAIGESIEESIEENIEENAQDSVEDIAQETAIKENIEENTKETQYSSPVYNVLRIPLEKIEANNYNPNSVALPEMKLLELSIWEDGYTMPIVCYYDSQKDKYIIVDGFHRYTTMLNSERIREREGGHMPVVVINKDLSNRMASTIRHNRARGTHDVQLMSNIVGELVSSGMSDAWIMKHIGMDSDELLRLKQVSGLASLFKDSSFSDCEIDF